MEQTRNENVERLSQFVFEMWHFTVSRRFCEKFRNDNLKNYGLCQIHYFSAPALTWDAMLNMKKVELELISDSHMYIFFEKGTRGGVSYITNRYSKAKNKYLNSYDPKQESKHIIYLEANNSYGYVMSKFLSTSGFNG